VNADTTGWQWLDGEGDDWYPSVSPDGMKVAFSCDTEAGIGLCTVNMDGTGRTTIFPRTDEPARASFSPDGTKIVFEYSSGISVMNADGTGVVSLGVSGQWPEWSPDGQKIAFVGYAGPNYEIYLMNPDGTGQVRVTNGTASAGTPSWSPDQTRLAFARSGDVYTIRPDGTGETRLTTSSDNGRPAWSPDGTKIAFASTRDHVVADPDFGGYIEELYVMNADGTGQTRITRNDQNEFGRYDTRPGDWQPIPVNAYPRPKGATPLRLPLVPASQPCTAPNRTHGAPLSFGSCAPPTPASGQLTTGTPDSNGKPATMVAFLLLRTIVGDPMAPGDQADVAITARVNDVFRTDLSDYTGSLRASLPVRITDKLNSPSPGGPGAGTTAPFQFGFDIPCTPDPDSQLGSDCSITTSADTLYPSAILEVKRSIWQIGRARVDDAGADGNTATAADNGVFAVQGVFVP